jgi:hypothetical protein
MPELTTRLKSHRITGSSDDTSGSQLVLDQEVNNLLDQLDNWEIPNPRSEVDHFERSSEQQLAT